MSAGEANRTSELCRAGGVGSDAFVDDGVLASLLESNMLALTVNLGDKKKIPVMKAFDAETFKAVEHVPVVFWGEKD